MVSGADDSPSPLPHETPVQQNKKCLSRFVFLPGALPDVSLRPVCFLSRMQTSAGLRRMRCDAALRKGLTFSPFKATLPGFGGWPGGGRAEVICHGDQASQLGDDAMKADRPSVPRAILSVQYFNTAIFFFVFVFFFLPSAFAHVNTESWAMNEVTRPEWRSHFQLTIFQTYVLRFSEC